MGFIGQFVRLSYHIKSGSYELAEKFVGRDKNVNNPTPVDYLHHSETIFFKENLR